MNNLTIAGNVGRDSELKQIQTNSGAQSVLSFAVAVKSMKKDSQGNYITQWFDCSLWGQRADTLVNYIKKGSSVTVCGSVELEQYTAKDGSAGAKMKVNAQNVTLQGSPSTQPQQQPQAQPVSQPAQMNSFQQPPAPPANYQNAMPAPAYAGVPPIYFDDDIPFAPIALHCQRLLHCM